MAHSPSPLEPARPRPPRPVPGLEALADRYGALIADVWGVLTDGVTLFADAADALARFRARDGAIALLTNSARPGELVLKRLEKLGLDPAMVDAVVTAGDCAKAVIAARFADRPLFHLGPDFDRPLVDGLPARPVSDPAAAEVLLATGPLDEDIAAHRPLLEEPARRGVPMVCANPDRWVRWGARRIPCAGLLADLYEELGGVVIRAGKPAPFCFEEAARRLGRETPAARRDVLVVGDGLETDIRGAQDAGLASVWISHGLHADQLENGVGPLLEQSGVCPDYVMERLRW